VAKYEDIREQLKSGDLAFYSSHEKLGDKLIKWWTHSKYSHVGTIWCIAGRVFLLEASAIGGVRMVPLSMRLPDTIVQMNLTWTPEAEKQAMEHMMEPYSFVDAIRAGLKQGYNESGWICTEYSASIEKECGYTFPDNARVPEDFIDILEKDNSRTFIQVEK
jgi:hypothetical protein